MVSRFWISIVPLILLAGGVLFSYLVFLGGAESHVPLNKFYYVQADTSGITGAQPITRWTPWNYCGVSDDDSVDCTSARPARAFQPQNDFTGMPTQFDDRHHYFYYMSRFTWVFSLFTVAFSSFALITSFAGLCSRIGAGITNFFICVALLFDIIAMSLATALSVKARNYFSNASMPAKVSSYYLGFGWASVAIFILCVVGFGIACSPLNDTRRYSARTPILSKEGGAATSDKKSRGRFFNFQSNKHQDGAYDSTTVGNERSSFERTV